jgi:hypothetical protein
LYLIVIVICLLCFVLFNAKVSADSPSFTLQQFTDSSDDFVGECLIKDKNSLSEINYIPDIDLKSISYISDGRFLNATLWLNNMDNGYIEFKELASFEIGKINSTKYKNNFTIFYEKFSQILLNISNYNLSLHSFDINKFYNDNKV